MTNTTLLLIATNGKDMVRETYRTFRQLSAAHHRWERRGWTVRLPLSPEAV